MPEATRHHFLSRCSALKSTPATSTRVPFTSVWTRSFGATVLMFSLFSIVRILSTSRVVSSLPPVFTAETVRPP
jgi:hypothetical protein